MGNIKICSKCKRELPLTSYFFHKGGGKTGFKSDCKECRGYSFGETRKSRVVNRNLSWSNSDIQYMEKHYANTDNKVLSNILNKSEKAIVTKARYLHLYKETWWSGGEIDLLKEYYPFLLIDELISLHLPNRSASGIKKKAMELGITKNEQILYGIRSNNLGEYIGFGTASLNWKGTSGLRQMARNRLNGWITSIKEKYNHTCALTGNTENLIVHHIVSFKEIFYDVLDKNVQEKCFPIYEDVSMYFENKLNNLLEEFLNEVVSQHSESTGILIRGDIHDLFHNFYGTHNCTEQDFFEFIIRCKNGEFNDVIYN